MELLIGRDSKSSRLSIVIDGKRKAMYGDLDSVPLSVSREHCKINIENSIYKILNVNPNNATYVNGNQVEQKSFNPQVDSVALGSDKYVLNVTAILKAVMIPAALQYQLSVQTYSIDHLENIWNANHETKIKFQIKERKANSLRSISGIISSLSIISAIIPGVESFRIPLILIGVIVGIYFAVVSYRLSSGSVLFMDNLDKAFRKNYICPNPDCHSFLSYNLPYEELLKKGGCPYCKSKFSSK